MSDATEIGWLGPTHDCWGWILGHFRNVSLLNERNVDDWLTKRSKSLQEEKKTGHVALCIAVDSRFDPIVELVHRIEQTVAPKNTTAIHYCTLLGDDWVGHRRTHPLPETLLTFYWYELYDRILPWLLGLSNSIPVAAPNMAQNAGAKRRISPRVQRWIDMSLSIESRLNVSAATTGPIKLAMVITETATTRQLWCDAFRSHEVQCLATTPGNLDVWATPDIVVVDLESKPLAACHEFEDGRSARPSEHLVRKLSRQFPDSIIVVTESFPRWETWNSLLDSGADLIVAKPFQLTGIYDTLSTLCRTYSPTTPPNRPE